MLSLALRRKSGESPSAPPIAKIVSATASSRQRPRCRANGAVDIVAALVERHQDRFLRDRRRNRRGFLGHPGGGVAGAAFGNFMNFEAAKAELAADIVEALAIALGQFPLRALLQPADGNDDEAHKACSRKAADGSERDSLRAQCVTSSARRPIRMPAQRASDRLRRSPDPASTIFPDCRTRAPRV